jgi:pimeloyl-ACP methyl ester carboxylesterase
LLILLPFSLVACGSGHHVRLSATPHSTLFDQKVSIVAQGAKPGSMLTLELQQDGWVGKATYRVGRDGDVRVAHAPSIAGTYRGVSPMGLFWSMKPPQRFGQRLPEDGGPATLEAFSGGKRVASASVVRLAMTHGVTTRNLTVPRDGFFGRYYAPPPGRNRHTPVLLFGGSEGGLSPTAEAGLMASHGYPALAVAYFAEPGLPQYLENIPLEYFARAIRWLDREHGVDPAHLAVYGVSLGANAALELGIHYPALVHAVIGIAPSAVVNGGLGPTIGPAWTYRGKSIPFTGAGAAIAVERIHGRSSSREAARTRSSSRASRRCSLQIAAGSEAARRSPRSSTRTQAISASRSQDCRSSRASSSRPAG